MGRPSDYTDEIAEKICNRLADGESLRAICRDEGMPDRTTVRRWLIAQPTFRLQYAQARQDQADSYADRIMDEMAAAQTTESAAVARVRIDALKWLACKLHPRAYGERIGIEHSGEIGLAQLVSRSIEQPAPPAGGAG